MLDWLDENWPLILGVGLIGLCVVGLVAIGRSESAYKAKLLAGAHTYADTLAVEQIMAQRATANAIAFGAGLVAGSRVR